VLVHQSFIVFIALSEHDQSVAFVSIAYSVLSVINLDVGPSGVLVEQSNPLHSDSILPVAHLGAGASEF
jgi:hypothetical protein